MKVFRTTGKFKMGREWQKFSKEVVEDNAEKAEDKILSLFGSKHNVQRTNIKIDEIQEITEDEVEDPFIQDLIETEE